MRAAGSICRIAALLLIGKTAGASELVYHPIDPSFGGSPFNGSFLLGVAEANNDFMAPPAKPKSFQQRLSEAIQNRLISAIAQQIVSGINGSGASNSGSFDLGDGTKVEFVRNPDNGEVDVTITDPQGNETHITFQS